MNGEEIITEDQDAQDEDDDYNYEEALAHFENLLAGTSIFTSDAYAEAENGNLQMSSLDDVADTSGDSNLVQECAANNDQIIGQINGEEGDVSSENNSCEDSVESSDSSSDLGDENNAENSSEENNVSAKSSPQFTSAKAALDRENALIEEQLRRFAGDDGDSSEEEDE